MVYIYGVYLKMELYKLKRGANSSTQKNILGRKY